MNVFADFHHAGLFESLRILFVDRLGHELYRPIGESWFDMGYWKIAEPYGNAPDTIGQYLGINDEAWDAFKNLNGNYVLEDRVYHIFDFDEKCHHKAITLETFRDMEFGIVIASIPSHILPYRRLIERFQPNAKLIYQVGNDWGWMGVPSVKNVMASAIIPRVPEDVHYISYHQEFDLDIFHKGEPHRQKNAYSFIHCMSGYPDWGGLLELEKAMPDYDFKFFGASCRDGCVGGIEGVADKMREAMWIVHVKAGGDGYGHAIHNAFAVGRPLIVKAGYYRGKLAEPLLTDGVTCVDLDNRSPQGARDMIRTIMAEGRYEGMVDACRERFDRHVNFDEEEKQLRVFLDNLQ